MRFFSVNVYGVACVVAMVWVVRSLCRGCVYVRCDSRPASRAGAISGSRAVTVRGRCAPGLVAGRYQPLADDVTIAGDVRPNLSSAVGSEDQAKRALDACKR